MARATSDSRRGALRRGHVAEFAALAFLMLKGYRPIARRFSASGGEIDLIVRRGRNVVFVEVKARGALADDEEGRAVSALAQQLEHGGGRSRVRAVVEGQQHPAVESGRGVGRPGEEPAAALAASLRRLRREWVEVLHLHDPDVVLDAEDPQLAAAATLVGAGTGAIGASVYTRDQFVAAVTDPRITVIQAPMNVLDRRVTDDDLRLAARSGTKVIARSALLQGLLGDPVRALGRVPQLDETLSAFQQVCDRAGRPPVELAIGWVRSRPGVAGIVLGAETSEQLEGTVRAFESTPLPAEVVALLSSLPLPPERAADPRTWPLT
jgi:aryl-alcohol dehydrogenase-like predicted oxidoreductase